MPRRVLGAGPISLGFLGAAGLALIATTLWPVDASAPLAGPGSPPLDLGRLAAADTGAALSQPLFDPERRPWTARGSREDLTAGERPQTLLSVRGILIEDRVRRALVTDGSGEPVWLGLGEGRGGWRLVSIEAAQVVVADAARHYTLAFLGPSVALRPPPREPAPADVALRPALSPTHDEPPAMQRALQERRIMRRIETTRPGTP